MVHLVLLPFLLLSPALHAQENHSQQTVQANASRVSEDGQSFFDVSASGFVRATPHQTWRVLTDYERLPEFVPDLLTSKVVSRNAHETIVEQISETGFLFMSQTIHMVIRIHEQPFSTVDVALVSGDMRHYAAHWELEPAVHDGMKGTRVTFTGKMEPDFFVPPFFGRAIVVANVRRMVEAAVAEIERRSAH